MNNIPDAQKFQHQKHAFGSIIIISYFWKTEYWDTHTSVAPFLFTVIPLCLLRYNLPQHELEFNFKKQVLKPKSSLDSLIRIKTYLKITENKVPLNHEPLRHKQSWYSANFRGAPNSLYIPNLCRIFTLTGNFINPV